MKKSSKIYISSQDDVINEQIPCMMLFIQGICPLIYLLVGVSTNVS
jgi:hypothetical protein